jgi:hypothetical protein
VKSSDDISSMDLLLDTICNAFGGIVFIALLMAVLSRAAGPTQPLDSATERLAIVQLQAEQRALEREISALKTEYDRIINATTTKEPAAHQEYYRNRQLLEEVMAELADLTDKLQQTREQLEDISVQRVAAQYDISVLQSEIARLQAIQPDPQDVVTETRRLPRLRPASGGLRQFFIVIRDGRFLPVTSIDYALTRKGGVYDPRFVYILEGPLDADFLDPIVPAGIPIQAGLGPGGAIRGLIGQLDPKRHLICFIISTNSFTEFGRVKTAFVERGYNYTLGFAEGAFHLTPGEVQSL